MTEEYSAAARLVYAKVKQGKFKSITRLAEVLEISRRYFNRLLRGEVHNLDLYRWDRMVRLLNLTLTEAEQTFFFLGRNEQFLAKRLLRVEFAPYKHERAVLLNELFSEEALPTQVAERLLQIQKGQGGKLSLQTLMSVVSDFQQRS